VRSLASAVNIFYFKFECLLLLQSEPLPPFRTNTASRLCCCYWCCSSSAFTMSLSLVTVSCHLSYLMNVDCKTVFSLNCRRGKKRMALGWCIRTRNCTIRIRNCVVWRFLFYDLGNSNMCFYYAWNIKPPQLLVVQVWWSIWLLKFVCWGYHQPHCWSTTCSDDCSHLPLYCPSFPSAVDSLFNLPPLTLNLSPNFYYSWELEIVVSCHHLSS